MDKYSGTNKNKQKAKALKAKARKVQAVTKTSRNESTQSRKNNDRVSDSNNSSQNKEQAQKPDQDWRVAIKGLTNEISKAWLPDISMTLLGATIFAILTNYLLDTQIGTVTLISLGGIYLIWLVIVLLIRHFPSAVNPKRKKVLFIPGIALTVIVIGLAGITIWVASSSKVETEFSGLLTAALDPLPKTKCKPGPPDSVAIYHGDTVTYITAFPCNIVTVAGEPLLTLSKSDQGLALSAKLFSEDGRIITEIENNEFTITQDRQVFFKRKRPDKSTLIVYDQSDKAVLYVRYLNPRAIRVNGIFRFKNRIPVIITNEKVVFENNGQLSLCSYDVQNVIAID